MQKKILHFYRKNANSYIKETINLDMIEILSSFISYLPPNGHILDLGCGSGRDTLFFQKHGFKVTAMDATPEIATICRQIIDQEVLVASAQSLNSPDCYDGIWACASLLHIPASKFTDTLNRLYMALKPGGICYMSFKKGNGERWDEKGRFFFDLTPNIIRQYLSQLKNIDLIDIEEQTKLLREKQQTWVNVFFQKKTLSKMKKEC
ncbi:MAG: class I SAM-dependent methyltransferase [Deltaproteobacteria bacterium]|nr:class I SAM-dependent methyltransferase [Deltaproteobacteria bacterium]